MGAHDSRGRGGGLEFAQYRPYERGDDLRRIDWKLYARSDRFFVRDAEREEPISIWIVLDASASMAQVDLARPDWSRFDATKRLTASLIEIALTQGDRFGVVVEAADGLLVISPDAGPRHRHRLLTALAPWRPGGVGRWDRGETVLGERTGPRDMVLFLTDGLDDACVAVAEKLAASGRDVGLIRILTADERDFPFRRGYRFRDAETGEQVIGDGLALREDFLARFGDARRALKARLDARQVRHAEHVIDQGADRAIHDLFRTGART